MTSVLKPLLHKLSVRMFRIRPLADGLYSTLYGKALPPANDDGDHVIFP